MRKLLLCFLTATALQGAAQTLLTIGNDSVSVSDFLYAYRKNNTGAHHEKALHNYLQLFIASKLKVKEAQARGLDTAAQFRSDLEGLRAQVMPAYLNDPQSVQRLVEEAFDRAQKDLRIAHIFISLESAAANRDTAAAYKIATEALIRLRGGTSFATVAAQYSDDSAAKSNGGDLGFITVFSLPYELENLAYNTPVGGISPLYRSKAGYHIFKVMAARPAMGRMRAAQILLAFPPEATAREKQALQQRADSLYHALQRGTKFGTLAEGFSHDAISAGAGGLLPEFGVGQYDPVFEQKVFALPRNGAISQPFTTAHGIHIVKRISLVPVPKTKTEAVMQQLRTSVQQSDRLESTRQQLAQKVLAQAGYQPLAPAMYAALQARTRQDFEAQAPADALNGNTVLFRLGTQEYTVDQWLEWARTFRYTDEGNSERPFEQLWNDFVQKQALNHYQQNLETYNADFRQQMAELREGNLFFEIMQQEVWTPAQNDTVALKQFYEQHKSAYRWNRSADAVLFYTGNKTIAQKLAAQVQRAPARWHEYVRQYATDVTTDSARLEWSTIPGSGKVPFAKGQVTPPMINPADGTAAFAYIIRVYDKPVQRSFEEARGAIINDYQAIKEKTWIEELRKKYPVKVNEEVLGKLKG